jgi:hypothetical protein
MQIVCGAHRQSGAKSSYQFLLRTHARKATYTVVILVNLYYAYCLHLGELFTRAELWWRSMSTAENQITYENGIVSPVFFSFYTKFKFLFVLLVCLSVCLPMCLTLPLLSIQVRFDAEYADQFEEGTKVAFGAISHGKTWRWSGEGLVKSQDISLRLFKEVVKTSSFAQKSDSSRFTIPHFASFYQTGSIR